MTRRASIGILIWAIGIATAQAQLSKQDSIRLKQLLEGKEEIRINTEALKDIEFNFTPLPDELRAKPKMDEHKPWMEFRYDLPQNYTDTTMQRKPRYIRLSPYTIYTKWNEIPVRVRKDTFYIRWKLDKEKLIPEGSGASVEFNADKLLYENLTKRGRAIKRNRKRAKAWKTYNDYVPTREDSIRTWKFRRK